MAPDEQVAGLYDFLYRDPVRIPSYYAQLFGGRLDAVELSTSARETQDKTGKLSVANVVAGEIKSGEDRVTGRKEVIDPTDLLAVDVLSKLIGSGAVDKDYVAAKPNSLILATGSVVFVDHTSLKVGKVSIASAIQAAKNKKGPKDRESIAGLEMIVNLLDTITLPSMFVMKSDRGILAGQVQDSGMAEPISAHYFKIGSASIVDVHLIGVKEEPGPPIEIAEGQFFNAAMAMAEALGKMMLPGDTIRVTPIALFRKHY